MAIRQYIKINSRKRRNQGEQASEKKNQYSLGHQEGSLEEVAFQPGL